jgi:hypothetical protein
MFGKSPKLQWSAIHGDQTNLDQFGSPKYVRSKDNNREGSQRAGSGLRDRHLLGYFIPSACRPVCGGTKSQLENFRVRPAGFGPLVHCSCEPCVAHFATSEGKGGSVESRIGPPSPPNWSWFAMHSDDAIYYRERAEAERTRAKSSSNAEIAEIHEELARLYEALIEHEQLRSLC